MEGVRCGSAMRRRIGQRLDDLHLLDDRAGPAVRDDHRQRIFMLRANVNEMNVEPVDLGDELRQGVELRLALAPVVIGRPIARELLHRRELHALRFIRRPFPVPANLVAVMRRRRSARSSSGTLKWNGRIVSASAAAAGCTGSRLTAPTAAVAARKSRRVPDNDFSDMIVLLG